MQKQKEKEFVIEPCTHTKLAADYAVSRKVLYARRRPYKEQIGKRKGYKYSLEQLLIIFELIGLPAHLVI